jgi:glycosyltransferase involved in cell wall biosynthesis
MTLTLPLTNGTIAIDYTAAHEQSAGIGRLVRELIRHLAIADQETDYRLFVAGATTDHLPTTPGPNFTWKPTRISPRWMARLWHRLLLPVPVEAFVGPIDLYHATDFALLPTMPGTKTILTVHDLSFVTVPRSAHPAQKRYLDRVVPRSVRRATHVIADSQATKEDLINLYGTPPDKISVLLSGVNAIYRPMEDAELRREIRAKYKIPPEADYLFSIGTVQPRKNYGKLMSAVARLRDEFPQLHLVIAGGRGWLDGPIYQAMDVLNLHDRVHFIGYVEDEDVPVLYSDALCTAYVSLYEGFGFPVVESMACATPVITSNVSSMPEVAGTAALLVDPYDIDAVTDAIRRMATDIRFRERLVEAGLRQAKRFTWEQAAQELLTIYGRVLSE